MSAIAENFKIIGTHIIQHYRAGNVTTELDYLPTKGCDMISIVCPVLMGNATIVTLTLKTAADAAATSSTALTENVHVWLNGVQLADAKAGSVPAAYYTYGGIYLKNVLVFEVPAIIVPEGKYLGIACNAGSANNYYTAVAIERTYYKG